MLAQIMDLGKLVDLVRWQRHPAAEFHTSCCLYTFHFSGQKTSHAIAKSIILRSPIQKGHRRGSWRLCDRGERQSVQTW